MTKTMILPFISVIAFVLKGIFNVDIAVDEQEVIAEKVVLIVAAGSILYGIVKNHFDKAKKTDAEV